MAEELLVKHLSGSRRDEEESFRAFPLRIGRAEECGLRFDPERDAKVSAVHAEIRRDEGGGFVVVDLGSTNGILLDGRRVEGSSPLPRQAVLEVGEGGPRLRLRMVDAASGISFAPFRQHAAAPTPPKPLVATEVERPAYAPAPSSGSRLAVLALVVGGLLALAGVLAYALQAR